MVARESRRSSSIHQRSRRLAETPPSMSGLDQHYQPLPPMFKYFGGKSKIARRIVKQMPEHVTFVEPFAGGASVTLAKHPSEKEVLNDKRADVMQFYRHVKSGKKVDLVRPSKLRFYEIRDEPEKERTPGEL